MMAITTSNSINVNACRSLLAFNVLPRCRWPASWMEATIGIGTNNAIMLARSSRASLNLEQVGRRV